MRFLTFFVCLFLFTACCTKRECEPAFSYNAINIALQGYSNAELQNVSVKVFNALTDILMGTENYDLQDNPYMVLDENRVAPYGNSELLNYYFVITTPVSSDTISEIQYEKYLVEYSCNTCLLKKDETYSFWQSRNFSFKYEGQTYKEQSQLTLIR